MSEYTDIERSVVQYLVSVGTAREEVLVTIHDKLKKGFEEELGEDHELLKRPLETSIDLINDKLHLLGYQIDKIRSQDTRELYFVYVNTVSDAPSKISTNHSPKEIDIIKKIIDFIITESEDESYVISSSQAIRICSTAALLTASESEHFLKQLVDEGWLNRSSKGRYSLSIRTLSELKRFLVDQYGVRSNKNPDGQINLCKGCNEIVTVGLRCFEESCYIKFHKECQLHYFRAKGSNCPNENCEVDWMNEEQRPLPVGEKRLRR
ncbi:Non-structural maintenance of chromosomes element 1 [Wickerhamomyces ciferrii]|uniref:Non-structural maintenance of chromosomes element 1 homolog n=1 Tax=Wickerhamomyces ciferrii (strain ATCC 14091 / BCRC 22168 / CBS 111 / JCM 3599 / NBRC 0793 / NRRL Y-1031 F-60-10) TaxID=1206466 RepID=K0K9Q2_WICCF|nr:Non-structural maintenance of chromosomes element 1 [Wickerhamomyces ciferrii]CCH41650.1 Non-structural maintenance of chromosomes element 1 [Wickerhamomyces ciferrii]